MNAYYLFYTASFIIGGGTYCALELLTRSRTHYSMFFCSGIAVMILLAVYYNNKNINPVIFSIIGAVTITSLEFIFGIIFNIILKMNVWDYSETPFNIYGQICLPFSLIWTALSFALYIIFRAIKI